MVIEEVSVIGAAGDRAKGRLGGSLAVQCQGGCQLLAGPGGGDWSSWSVGYLEPGCHRARLRGR